jgi:hypothetical protein
MFKNRLTLGYLVLVGVPLLFLVGTLRAGRTLTAPPALSGDWTIQPTDTPPGSQTVPPSLSIYQTGADLLITFRDAEKTQFTARLESGRIAGAVSLTPRTWGGQGVTAVKLDASLGGMPGRRFLEGQIAFEGCPSCTPIKFRATKSITPER